jgi:enoyl-CoA hydratase/carnithine racemase
MVYEQILYEVKDHILTLTLNRPDHLNAFTPQMRNEIIDALDRANADDHVRAIIVTGAGRAFCAGMDLGSSSETFDYQRRDGQTRMEEHRDGGGQLVLRQAHNSGH